MPVARALSTGRCRQYNWLSSICGRTYNPVTPPRHGPKRSAWVCSPESQKTLCSMSLLLCKDQDQKQLGKDSVCFISATLRSHPVTKESHSRNSRCGNWSRNRAGMQLTGLYLLACCLLSCTLQDHMFRDGTTHSGQDPSILIISQENVPQTLPIEQSGGGIFSVEFPFWNDSSPCQVDNTTTRTIIYSIILLIVCKI